MMFVLFCAVLCMQEAVGVVTRGPGGKRGVPGAMQAEGKPWKKHNNRHKKEKIRRTVPTLVS